MKKQTLLEKKENQFKRILLAPSCAGCEWHDVNMAGKDYQKPDLPTQFVHWCLNPAYQEIVGIVPLEIEGKAITARIAPPQPSWCKVKRPSYEN